MRGIGATAQAKLRIFISSTSGALKPYRLAAVEVCHRLGLTRCTWRSSTHSARHPNMCAEARWKAATSTCWDLRDAGELLDSMGEPYPDLPVTNPATVRAPLEDKVHSFIAKLEKG